MNTKTTPKKVVKKAAKKPGKKTPKKPVQKGKVPPQLTPFKPGNKAAEIWTEDKVMEKLNAIWETIISDTTGMANNNPVRANDLKLIGEVRLIHGVTKQQWSEWKQKFKDNVNVSDRIGIIEETLEYRLIYSGERMDEFVLKNKYGYKDRVEQDVKASVTGSISPDKWLLAMSGQVSEEK